VQKIGAGIARRGDDAVASLGGAVHSVLVDVSYSLAAQEVAADIAALAPVHFCVAIIEHL
jgi:hypothetical protein